VPDLAHHSAELGHAVLRKYRHARAGRRDHVEDRRSDAPHVIERALDEPFGDDLRAAVGLRRAAHASDVEALSDPTKRPGNFVIDEVKNIHRYFKPAYRAGTPD